MACSFIKKELLVQVFPCEFSEILKNIFFTEHLWATACDNTKEIEFLEVNKVLGNWISRKQCWKNNKQRRWRRIISSFKFTKVWKWKILSPDPIEESPSSEQQLSNGFQSIKLHRKDIDKKHQLSKKYCEIIEQYIKRGYLEYINVKDDSNDCWYLLYFPVLRPDKFTTESTTMVFDRAASVMENL